MASPKFLAVRQGDLVVVNGDASVFGPKEADWWLGHVIHVFGSARDSSQNSLFQVVDVDTGVIKTINADLVTGILRPRSLL